MGYGDDLIVSAEALLDLGDARACHAKLAPLLGEDRGEVLARQEKESAAHFYQSNEQPVQNILNAVKN